MSRRTWIVLLIVVAVLAIAPHLPDWWPALVGAVRDFNITTAERSVLAFGARAIALANQGIAFTRERPSLMLGAGVGGAVAVLIVGVRRLFRGRAIAPPLATPAITVLPSALPSAAAPLPVVVPARAAHRHERTALAPTTLQATETPRVPSRRRATAGRGMMVRRLSVAGHSTAEIARATHVGQDAVRLVLLRHAPS